MSRPLQNRVDPYGAIVATSARGLMMGNRGGRIHDDAQSINRMWASKQWICCVLEFKERARTVMGKSYTELFFLDEAVALAAGHRPCFECRRQDAVRFASLWAAAHNQTERAKAPEMDAVLHRQRLSPSDIVDYSELPDGAFFKAGGTAYLTTSNGALPWSFDGYGSPIKIGGTVEALTCPAIRDVLKMGYAPHLHPSAM